MAARRDHTACQRLALPAFPSRELTLVRARVREISVCLPGDALRAQQRGAENKCFEGIAANKRRVEKKNNEDEKWVYKQTRTHCVAMGPAEYRSPRTRRRNNYQLKGRRRERGGATGATGQDGVRKKKKKSCHRRNDHHRLRSHQHHHYILYYSAHCSALPASHRRPFRCVRSCVRVRPRLRAVVTVIACTHR